MSQSKLTHDELLELLAGHCAGTLPDADAQRLAAVLRDSDHARRTFIQYMDLHSSLAWESSSVADLDELVDGVSRKEKVSGARRVLRFFVATRWRVALTVASCFVVVMLAIAAFTPAPLFRFTRGEREVEPGSDRVIAARITGGVDCRWQETALPLGFGSSLYKGQQIELLSGTAEITFESGAVVTLAGPAVYVIDSHTHSSLRVGELAALVPRRAKGFSVQTPAAMVVDRGTEFGIVVFAPQENDGPATEEIHVFRGVVEYSLRDSNAAPQRLTSNQAVRIAPSRHVEQLASAHRESFPPKIAADGDTTTAETLPKNQHPPVTRGLTLWLSADGAVRLGANNTVDVWEDMLTGENTKAQNAYPVRSENQPRLVPNAINGRPAVRFDGDDYLTLSTPSDLGILDGAYEMFIVARTAAPAIQFLIAGGVGDYEIHVNGDAGARFIPAGYADGAGASDLGVNQQFSDGRPHLFAARISPDGEHRGMVQVDGQDTTDSTVGEGHSMNNTSLRLGMRYDGSYPLNGEIAEVLIYRTSLPAAERKNIGRYLAQKYEIDISF